MEHNNITYTLTSTDTICCHGTSFPSLIDAKNYAMSLQQDFGICKTFSIGRYSYHGHMEVYNSERVYQKEAKRP